MEEAFLLFVFRCYHFFHQHLFCSRFLGEQPIAGAIVVAIINDSVSKKMGLPRSTAFGFLIRLRLISRPPPNCPFCGSSVFALHDARCHFIHPAYNNIHRTQIHKITTSWGDLFTYLKLHFVILTPRKIGFCISSSPVEVGLGRPSDYVVGNAPSG